MRNSIDNSLSSQVISFYQLPFYFFPQVQENFIKNDINENEGEKMPLSTLEIGKIFPIFSSCV